MKKHTAAILGKSMLRTTKSNWKQFLAIICMGALAMTLFIGLLSNSQSLSSRVEAFYKAGDLPDMWVLTSSPDGGDYEDILSYVDEKDEVDARFQITNKVNDKTYYGAIVGETPKLSHPVEIVDRTSEQTDLDFFMIDKANWNSTGLEIASGIKLGEEVTLSFDSSYFSSYSAYFDLLDTYVKEGKTNIFLGDSIELKATVTGVMTFPENIQLGSYSTPTYLMSKSIFRAAVGEAILENFDLTPNELLLVKTLLNWTSDAETNLTDYRTFPGANEYLIKLSDQSTLETKEEAIESFYASKGDDNDLVKVLDRSLNPWSVAVDTEVTEAEQLAFVFPIVFFLVAVLVILTTTSELVVKERTQIGTLKALGVSKRLVYWQYVSLIMVLIGIASLIGFVAGPLILPAIMAMKYNILYSLPARSLFVFPWWQALLTLAVFMGISILVTILTCRKEIKLLPSESMRPKGANFKGRPTKTNRKIGPIGLSVKMAFRNVRVNLVKSSMVVFGVMGCTALLVAGFGIEDTLNYSVDLDIGRFYSSSLVLNYTSARTDETPDYLDALLSRYPDADVDQYFSSSTSTVSAGEKELDSSFRLISDDHPYFDLDIPKGTVAISQKIANGLGIGVGDQVNFSYGTTALTGTVGLVYDAFYVHGVTGIYSDFKDVFNRGYTTAYLQLGDDYTENELMQVKQYLLANVSYLSEIATKYEMATKISDILSGVMVMTTAVKVFAILLAVVVLYNLALLNFTERTRDIATLKVCGFNMAEIGLSLILETLTLTAVGFLVGAALGYPFMYLVLYVNRVSIVEYIYHINAITYLWSFLLTFVLAFAVNFYLATMTRKVKMVESLKSVE